MKTRKLIDGLIVTDEEVSVKMTIDSKCPAKWVFADLETGDLWEYRDDTFKRASIEKTIALSAVSLASISSEVGKMLAKNKEEDMEPEYDFRKMENVERGKYHNKLKELVDKITDENQHGEVDWGKPVGNEVW